MASSEDQCRRGLLGWTWVGRGMLKPTAMDEESTVLHVQAVESEKTDDGGGIAGLRTDLVLAKQQLEKVRIRLTETKIPIVWGIGHGKFLQRDKRTPNAGRGFGHGRYSPGT